MSKNEKQTVKPVNIASNEQDEILIVRVPSPSFEVLQYKGLKSIGTLISFLGLTPQINPDLSLKVKKFTIKENDFIFRDGTGEILRVVSDMDNYQLITRENFSEKFARVVQPIVPKERKKREPKVKK